MARDLPEPKLVAAAGKVVKRRKPGTAATDEDYEAAHAYLADVYGDSWNPWRRDDEAEAIAQAHAVLDQWETSGGATAEEVEAWMKACDEYRDQKYARGEAQRKRRKVSYDEQRESDRLELLEAEAGLRHRQERLDELADSQYAPAMDPGRRAAEAQRTEQELHQASRRVAALRDKVGDPESVIDRHGHLPADRRRLSLTYFDAHRAVKVRELRARRDDLGQQIAATAKSQRRPLHAELRDIERDLELWVGIPKPAVEDMCSECPKPLAWHARRWNLAENTLGKGPCPAYPSWRARMERVWEILSHANTDDRERAATPPPQPRRDPRTKAQLLDEIDRLQARLTESQARRPTVSTPPAE